MPAKHKPRPAQRVPLPRWRVRIRPHTSCGRYRIEASVVTLPAPTRELAITFAVAEVHARANAAPWRPCRAESRRYASAERLRS
jgi:hypothetical protein